VKKLFAVFICIAIMACQEKVTEIGAGGSAISAREGSYLRTEPRALSSRIVRVPYGTTCDIISTSGGWCQIACDQGSGWVRCSDVQDRATVDASASSIVFTEVSAAGRQ